MAAVNQGEGPTPLMFYPGHRRPLVADLTREQDRHVGVWSASLKNNQCIGLRRSGRPNQTGYVIYGVMASRGVLLGSCT